MPICRLCQNDRTLIKAHVIPEAFLSFPPPEVGVNKILSNKAGHYPKRSRIGIYDSGILCGECDADLGELDQHAVEQLCRSDEINNISRNGEKNSREYLSADPEKIHKFIASVAWRASISSHDFFQGVGLGPYEELIREMLLSSEFDNTQVETMLAEFDRQDPPNLDPHLMREEGVKYWLIYANRFILYLKADNQPTPKVFEAITIQKDSPVRSVMRQFGQSKEQQVIQGVVKANPNAFRRS